MTLAGIRVVDAHGMVVDRSSMPISGSTWRGRRRWRGPARHTDGEAAPARAAQRGGQPGIAVEPRPCACSSPCRWSRKVACSARCWCHARHATSCRRCTASDMPCWAWRSFWSRRGRAGLVRGLHGRAADAPACRDGATRGRGRCAGRRAAGLTHDTRGPVAVGFDRDLARTLETRADYVRDLASASATNSRRRSPASAAAPNSCATISRKCRRTSAPGSCRTSWPTPRGSNGWCAASSSWRAPTPSCRAARRPVTWCGRQGDRGRQGTGLAIEWGRRRCPRQSTAPRSISCFPTWSRTPSSTAGRRHGAHRRARRARGASS